MNPIESAGGGHIGLATSAHLWSLFLGASVGVKALAACLLAASVVFWAFVMKTMMSKRIAARAPHVRKPK